MIQYISSPNGTLKSCLYKAHLDKAAAEGLVLRNPDGEFHLTRFKTAYSAENIGVMDIVILMVKATQTDSAMEGAKNCIGPAEKSAVTDAAGGLEPEYFDDVRPYVWHKATSSSGFNPVCAMLRLKIREVYGVALVWQIWHEAADVAEAMGIPGIWKYMQKETLNVVNNLGDYYHSMAQDMLMHRRQTEVTCLTGAISDYGKKTGVPTPACDVLTQVVKAQQDTYALQYVKQ